MSVPSNQIKLHLLLFYPSTWYLCDVFLLNIEIEGKGGWIIGAGGGGGKGYVAPPPKLFEGGLAPPAPPPPPSSYTYEVSKQPQDFLVYIYLCGISEVKNLSDIFINFHRDPSEHHA